MKRVFFDTNFLMDLLVREGDFKNIAEQVLALCVRLNLELYVSFLSIANFAYVVRKYDTVRIREYIRLLCSMFSIISNTERHILDAIDIQTRDYEDALQYETALSQNCDCIITRNNKDFKFSELTVLTPDEFLIKFG